MKAMYQWQKFEYMNAAWVVMFSLVLVVKIPVWNMDNRPDVASMRTIGLRLKLHNGFKC